MKKWEKLLKAWSYSVSIFELEKIQFVASERPQYLIKKIANIGSRNSLEYAFTLFSATEIVSPYVSPAETHLYILKEERDKWEKILPKNNIFPGEKGNVICFLADESFFYKRKKIKDKKVISLPQLYTDLFSYGGRGAEAAEKILEVIKRV